jgi:hypothetical protein
MDDARDTLKLAQKAGSRFSTPMASCTWLLIVSRCTTLSMSTPALPSLCASAAGAVGVLGSLIAITVRWEHV